MMDAEDTIEQAARALYYAEMSEKFKKVPDWESPLMRVVRKKNIAQMRRALAAAGLLAHTEPAETPVLVAEAIADGSHALALEDLRDDLARLRTQHDTATSLIDSLRGELTSLRRTVATALGVDTHLPTEELIERLQARPVPSPEPRFTARLDDEGDWFVWDRDKARRDARVLDQAEAEALARSLNARPVPSSGTTSEPDPLEEFYRGMRQQVLRDIAHGATSVGASQPTSNDEAGSIGTTSEPDRDGWFTPSEAWDALQKHTGAPSDMPVGEAIATLAWLHAEACWYRDEVKQLRAAAGVGASSAPGPVPSVLTDIANRVSDTTDVNSEPSGQPQPGDTVRDHILPACTCHQSVRDCPWHAEEAAEYARQLTEDAIAEKREYLAEKALRRNAQEVSR